MKNKKLFEVKNLDKTLSKHARRIESLEALLKQQELDYHDILDSYAWQAVDTEVEKSLQLIESMGIKQTDRQIARIINQKTRDAIVRSLEFYEIAKSYDTAFFMANYMKTIEGMVEILETNKERLK